MWTTFWVIWIYGSVFQVFTIEELIWYSLPSSFTVTMYNSFEQLSLYSKRYCLSFLVCCTSTFLIVCPSRFVEPVLGPQLLNPLFEQSDENLHSPFLLVSIRISVLSCSFSFTIFFLVFRHESGFRLNVSCAGAAPF